ncbi:MAG: chlorite dismutase family protein, partial [Nitrospirales bacterium]
MWKALSTMLVFVSWTIMAAPVSAADGTTYGTFAVFAVNESWANQAEASKQKGIQEAKQVAEAFRDRVQMDAYWTYGLTPSSHFMLRLHAANARANQDLLTALAGTGLGWHLRVTFTITGVIKGLNHAPDFPDLLAQLKAAQYEGPPPVYAIMIPTRKDAARWNLSKDQRIAMMREHTEPTLAYLK